MSSLRASSMALSASTRASASMLAALLDDAGEQVGDRAQLGDVRPLNARGCSVCTLSTPIVWSCQMSGTLSIEATNRRWSMPRTHRKRGSALTSGMTSGCWVGGDVAGHALAERDPGAADLEPVQAVRRRQRQVRSVAIEQVEGGDIGMERVPRLVDDRREQLVPGAGRRREPGDVVEEAELLELRRDGRRASIRPSRSLGGPRVSAGRRSSRYKARGCGRRKVAVAVLAVASGPDRCAAAPDGTAADRQRPGSRRRAEPRGIGTAGARDPLAREVRLLGALLGQVIVEQAGRRPVRRRRADPTSGDRSCAARATRATRRRQAADLDALDLGPTEAVMARSPCISSSSTSPRPAAACGPCGGASGPRATGSSTTPLPTPSTGSGGPATTTPRSTRCSRRLRIGPVLTAHPTEARRRTALVALRRCAGCSSGSTTPA